MNYQRIYDAICNRAKKEKNIRIQNKKDFKKDPSTGKYYEGHHIVPKCIGGTGESHQWEDPNIVLLTPKEHYMAHRLLTCIYPSNARLHYALWRMMCSGSTVQTRHLPSARIYERLRLSYIRICKQEKTNANLKGKSYEELYGIEKASQLKSLRKLRGKERGMSLLVSNDAIEKREATKRERRLLNPNYGICTDQAKLISSRNKERCVCPHCNKEIQYISRNRYHFDSCKLKK
jgi:hypothetical protein